MAEAGDGGKGFKRTSGLTGDHYLYDLNGNMTQDKHNGFVFAYNYLNLPQSFTQGANAITMTYTADGEKLSKALSGGGATKNYISGIEYSGANLEAIYFSEGRCTPNGATAFFYEYTIKDHLGNARVNFRASGITVANVEGMHYYPFGMQMEGLGTQNPANKYLYNGKERNEDFGLGLYDYGARWYDAALGRFVGVDPISAQFSHVSTFNYAENEPVGSIDLWGLQRLKVSSLGGQFFYRTSAASGWIQKSATLGAAMKHPIAAAKVGAFKSGSTNISSVSSRISRHVALDGNNLSTGIGSERNALRHTIWSATINKEFGASIAETLTNAHEGIGFAESAFVDMDSPFEGDMSLADDVVDFLNNKIGRSITSEGDDLSTLEIAMDALDVFKDEGLYTASIDNDGNVTIQRSKITQKQYDTAMEILHQLTNDGFSAKEQKERDK
jgi:RHS repeat-associated protein